MPLVFVEPNEEKSIKKINGNIKIKRHLENLGFIEGSLISIVTKINGNLIVNMKGSRVAISEELARKIIV